MTTGVPMFGGVVASGTEGKVVGSAAFVILFVTARRAKSYSPVPLGALCVSVVGFAWSHGGDI